MSWTKIVGRLAAICALVVAGAVFTAAPASADDTSTTLILGGDPAAQTEFEMYFYTRIYEHPAPQTYESWTESYTYLELGKYGVISASNCTVETWLTLTQDRVSYWDSPHWTYPCETNFINQSSDQRGTFIQVAHTPHFDTVAGWALTHGTVRLYYGGSNTPGHTYPMEGSWTQTS